MLEQWQVAMLSVGAFVCVLIGYWLRYIEQKEYKRDETENQVGDVL
jgi:hypothetical protein